MGGGGGGSSKTKSKSQTTPEQQMMWSYYFNDVVPQARGEDTWLSRRMEQSARDAVGAQSQQAQEQIMEVGAKTGMGSAQIAGLQNSVQSQGLQQGVKAVTQAKMTAAQQAMQMISGLPMMGEKSESKQKGSKSYLWGAYSG